MAIQGRSVLSSGLNLFSPGRGSAEQKRRLNSHAVRRALRQLTCSGKACPSAPVVARTGALRPVSKSWRCCGVTAAASRSPGPGLHSAPPTGNPLLSLGWGRGPCRPLSGSAHPPSSDRNRQSSQRGSLTFTAKPLLTRTSQNSNVKPCFSHRWSPNIKETGFIFLYLLLKTPILAIS